MDGSSTPKRLVEMSCKSANTKKSTETSPLSNPCNICGSHKTPQHKQRLAPPLTGRMSATHIGAVIITYTVLGFPIISIL